MKKMEVMPEASFQAFITKYGDQLYGEVPDEIWLNDKYEVWVRRGIPIPIKSKGDNNVTVTHLSIKRHDKKAVIDWREFQWIKNDIVGPENEGIELYPAESRLVDNANQFHLWVFEDVEASWPVGYSSRLVSETSQFGETQRKWPELRKPSKKDFEHSDRSVKRFQDENS